MDKRVLVVYAGRYGSTAEVAEAVAEELRRCGAAVDASPVTEGIRLDAYDAIVVGSAIYWEHWLPEAARFVEQNREALGHKRVACFLLCMELTRVTEDPGLGVPVTIDPRLGGPPRVPGKLSYWERTHLLSAILDPVLDAAPEVHPVSVGVFRGRVDYRRLRFVHFVLMKLTWLLFRRAPEGDFRNWEAIRSWASSLCPMLLPEEERSVSSATSDHLTQRGRLRPHDHHEGQPRDLASTSTSAAQGRGDQLPDLEIPVQDAAWVLGPESVRGRQHNSPAVAFPEDRHRLRP